MWRPLWRGLGCKEIKRMAILTDIVKWVEDKPKFWQVAIDRLIRNNQLTLADIIELKEICKTEFRLSNRNYLDVDFDDLREFAENSSSSNSVVLTKIFNIENINALAKTNVLEFSTDGLTVVYGDNGAGKSSYVSILKHVCNTRGSKPVIHDNLFDPLSKGADKKAEVEYSTDSVNFYPVKLKNGIVDNSVLKRVDVFDSESANHYIEGEDEIAFIPRGLSIIERFASCLNQIETAFENDIHALELSKFDVNLLQIADETPAKLFLNTFNEFTTVDQLEHFSQFDDNKAERIAKLESEVNSIKSRDPVQSIKLNTEKINRFLILKLKYQNLENNLLGDKLNSYLQILNNYVSRSKTLKVTTDTVFSGLPLNGIGNDSWKQLWESARKFYNEIKKQNVFPEVNDDSVCPLCLQDLNINAKQRFTDFDSFVKEDVQQEYDKAITIYNSTLEGLNNLSFNLEEQEPIIKELEELYPSYENIQSLYLETLLNQKNYLIRQISNKESIETLEMPEFEESSKVLIQALIDSILEDNDKLKTLSIADELKPLENELVELKNEKIIHHFKPQLIAEISRLKKYQILSKCHGKCNTRIVTNFSNTLASTYITQNLRQNFNNELDNFGFKNIKIEPDTKGIRGKQYHFLRLNEPNAQNIALKDILSEGEHRCIALSTFFSELSLSEHKSTIIFDDPVSSLDHKWRNKIAKRIVEESKHRQVIVFSHDITFLLMLQEHSNKQNTKLDIRTLTRRNKETGIIASNPPWDALPVNKRIGMLKDSYQNLEKMERTQTEEIYKDHVKFLYGKLRETWERFIEEVFLNGVVQRFGREIQTKRLLKIVDLTIDDYNIVDESMGKCSTYFYGHDSSGSLIEGVPNSDEFLQDVTILENFMNEIRKRRR